MGMRNIELRSNFKQTQEGGFKRKKNKREGKAAAWWQGVRVRNLGSGRGGYGGSCGGAFGGNTFGKKKKRKNKLLGFGEVAILERNLREMPTRGRGGVKNKKKNLKAGN